MDFENARSSENGIPRSDNERRTQFLLFVSQFCFIFAANRAEAQQFPEVPDTVRGKSDSKLTKISKDQ